MIEYWSAYLEVVYAIELEIKRIDSSSKQDMILLIREKINFNIWGFDK